MRDRADAATAAASVPSPQLLGSLVARGLAWKGISQVVVQGTRLLVALLIARLLAPHDYGLAGMVLAFTGFVFIFSDLALGNTLIQRRTIRDVDMCTVFWTSIAAGTLFTAVGFTLAEPVAGFYGEREVEPLLQVFSLTFLITSVGTTQNAILVRAMDFRSLELREMAATLASGVVGVLLALSGFGVWAIIGQQLTFAAMATVLVWRYSSWRPRLVYSLASLRDIVGFSGNVFGVNVISQLRGNMDNLLVGRFLGASSLGLYALAYNVVLVPLNRIAVPIAQVLFPALSRLDEDRALMKAYWLRAVRTLAMVAVPALLGLIVVAPEFVALVLGQKWADTAPVIRLLAWVALLRMIVGINGIALLAIDRASLLFVWTLFSYALTLGALLAGLRWGIVGAAAGVAIASTVVEPVYMAVTARALHVALRDVVAAVVGVAGAGAAMLTALLLARWGLAETGVGAAGTVATLVVVGAVAFGAAVWSVPDLRDELRATIGRFRRSSANAVASAPSG